MLLRRKNPCGLGIWAKYEGIIDFHNDRKYYIYRRRLWAHLWPWYWKEIIIPIWSPFVYTVKQKIKYDGYKRVILVVFYYIEYLLGIDRIISIPVPLNMAEGVNTIYNCVRNNPEEWTVDPYTGLPITKEVFEYHYGNGEGHC